MIILKKYFFILLTFSSLNAVAQPHGQKVFVVKDFGAAGDGKTDDVVAIQKAIDACNTAGGGTVLFTAPFTYMASPFNIKSDIELHIQGGAKILANPDEKVYTKSAFRQNPGEGTIWIGGENVENFTISGMAKLMAMEFRIWVLNLTILMS